MVSYLLSSKDDLDDNRNPPTLSSRKSLIPELLRLVGSMRQMHNQRLKNTVNAGTASPAVYKENCFLLDQNFSSAQICLLFKITRG